jgi:hypothetical protein
MMGVFPEFELDETNISAPSLGAKTRDAIADGYSLRLLLADF